MLKNRPFIVKYVSCSLALRRYVVILILNTLTGTFRRNITSTCSYSHWKYIDGDVTQENQAGNHGVKKSCVTLRVRRHDVDIELYPFKIHYWERYAGILRRHVAQSTSGLCYLCLRNMPVACQRHSSTLPVLF